MSELKKGGIRAAMSENTERETLRRMGQRSGPVNHETEVKREDINVIHNLFYEYHYADDLGVVKSKLAEYVATVRREEREATFKAVRERIEATNPTLTFGSTNGSVMKKCILMEIADLEQRHAD